MFFKRIDAAAERFNQMAEKLDVGVADRMIVDPDMAPTAYRSAILKCAACAEQEACAAMMAESEQLKDAPDYCPNRAYFAA